VELEDAGREAVPPAARVPLLSALALSCALAGVPLVLVELFPALHVVMGTSAYLVFHNVAEFFGVMVALSVFGVGWYTHDQSRDHHALFLGSAFLAVGLVQFMHALSYAGMPDFVTPSSPNKASQLWVIARACTAAAFLASAFVRPHAETPWLSKPVLGSLAVAVSLAAFLSAVVFPGTLPDAFVPGVGQTPFKRLVEYGIVATFVAAIVSHAWRFARRPDPAAALYLAGFVLSAFAELFFAAYRSVTDTRNALGHLYTVVAFYLVYRAVFIESVQRPHRALLEAAAALRLERDERVVAQAALARALEEGRREHDRVAAIMEASPVALVRVDAGGTVGYLNAEAERVLGVGRGEVAGRPFDAPAWGIRDEAGQPVDPADLPYSVIARTRAPVRARHAVQDPGGRTKVLDIVGAPLLDSRGVFEGAVFGLEDASERARMEEQFRQSQKMEAVGRLAGGIAHDFNNVLTAVLSAADYLLRELPPSSPLREEAEEIRVGGRKAATLTRQLLTFSRKEVVVPRVLSLGALVGELIPLLRRLIGEDVELAWEAPASLANVRADAGQLEQVIVNLVVNARDAVSSGGRISITLEDVEVGEDEARGQVGVRPGRFVLLAVADDGCGMTREVLAHAFEPFFTTKAPGKGTGLGLSTIYGIVRQCGGHVRVESQPGAGSLFRIFLPRAEGDVAAPVEAPFRPPQAAVVPASILLVEDEPQVRGVLARALRRAGYAVVEATDGDDAVEWALDPARSLDVLVTDLVMPHLGGQDLAVRVRAARPGVKVLFISGYSGQGFDVGLLGPEVAFLPKPITPPALVEEVQRLVQAEVRAQAARA
jgi:PAS domain S-box-containing protein